MISSSSFACPKAGFRFPPVFLSFSF
jgi:hypothetical protein